MDSIGHCLVFMKILIKYIIAFLPLFFCAFECEDNCVTIYTIRNSTEHSIVLQTETLYEDEYCRVNRPPEYIKLSPGYTVEVRYEGYTLFSAINNYIFRLSSENGTLLRLWAYHASTNDIKTAIEECNPDYYFEQYGVRLLHNPKEWSLEEYANTREYIFDIYPEDLIPLQEICEQNI